MITMKEISGFLQASRQLLTEKKWTTEDRALNAEGLHCDENSPDAVAFSFYGAIRHVCRDLNHEDMGTVVDIHFTANGMETGRQWYQWESAPGRTLDEVLAAVDKAIASIGPLAEASNEPTAAGV